MVHRVAGIVVALCFCANLLGAQTAEIRITSVMANVHKSPSTGSPVIGTAEHGTRLEVTRDVGSWVKVVWPQAPDGIGYVHVSMGRMARHEATANPVQTTTVAPARPAAVQQLSARPSVPPQVSPGPRPGTQVWRTSVGEEVVVPIEPSFRRPAYIRPPTHVVGLGGRMGSSILGYGASARAWSRSGVGAQFEVSRARVVSSAASGRLSSTQFAPSVLYSPSDRVTDFVWVRPYLGTGINLNHQTLAVDGDSSSDNNVGLQVFGGTELTMPSVPRFALGVDVGYRWARTPFADFSVGGLGISVQGHWYMK